MLTRGQVVHIRSMCLKLELHLNSMLLRVKSAREAAQEESSNLDPQWFEEMIAEVERMYDNDAKSVITDMLPRLKRIDW